MNIRMWKLIQLWLGCMLAVGTLALFCRLGAETAGMSWAETAHYVVTVPFESPDKRPVREKLKALFTPPPATTTLTP